MEQLLFGTEVMAPDSTVSVIGYAYHVLPSRGNSHK